MVSIDVVDVDLPFSPNMSPHDKDEKTLNLCGRDMMSALMSGLDVLLCMS